MVLGFSLESFGAWSSQALKVANIIKKEAEGQVLGASPKEIYLSTIQSISLTLQRGNTLIVTSGAKQAKFGLVKKNKLKNHRSPSQQTLPVDKVSVARQGDEDKVEGHACANVAVVGSEQRIKRSSNPMLRSMDVRKTMKMEAL